MGLGIMLIPLARAAITARWRATFALFGALTWAVALVAVRRLYDRPAISASGVRRRGGDGARGARMAAGRPSATRRSGSSRSSASAAAPPLGADLPLNAHAMDAVSPRWRRRRCSASGATSIAG
jgi:hypothetical protein